MEKSKKMTFSQVGLNEVVFDFEIDGSHMISEIEYR
jgi:hypothetical protein